MLARTPMFPYIASVARSRWSQTLKLPTQTATCSEFVEMPLNPQAPFPRLMFVLRNGWLSLPSRRLSDDMCTFIRSFFAAAVGRFSTFLRYQVMYSHSHSHSHTVYLPIIIIGILLQDESRSLTNVRFLN